jgi:hypothetical protein
MLASINSASPVPKSHRPKIKTKKVFGETFQFESPADQEVFGTVSAGRIHCPNDAIS